MPNVGDTPEGKGKIAAKALIDILKKYSDKVDSAIKKGIDILPISSSLKTHWKKVLTTAALIKVLDNFVGISDTAENLLTKGIEKIIPGIPECAASGISKTIMMFLTI